MFPVRAGLPELELLVAVADTGSLSAAASLLGIAQPNASRQLSRLERRLGATLIDRGARGSEPTAAGFVAIDHARRVLDASDALVEQVRAAAGRGRVRILASQTIAEQLMPTFLATLAADQPEVPVAFEVANTREVIAGLRRGRVDLGFVEGAEIPATLSSMEVARDRLVAVLAPDHPWAARTSIDAAELAATPLIVREEGSGTRDVLARALAPWTPTEPALEVHSNAAVRTAVEAGAGCALLSELAVAEHVRAGRLVALDVTGADLRRSLRAVWSGQRPARLETSLRALHASRTSAPWGRMDR